MRFIKHPLPTSLFGGVRSRTAAFALSAIALSAAQSAFGQASLGSLSYELAGNTGESNATLAESYDPTGNSTTASTNTNFTGLDGSGNQQTMNFTGSTTASAQYGQLHVYTTGTLTNSYYNVNNPAYANNSGGVADPSGSPDSLSSLGFADFTDTLQFGGALVTGYQAIYIFHVDGTNTGGGAASDLAVNVQGDPSQGFYDFNEGYLSTDWATTPFAVNGTNAQQINIQFSDQAVFNTFQMTDGTSASATSDFSQTLTLAGVELVDANGNPLTGWTMSSASGTVYNQVVPEPGTWASFLGFAGSALFMRRRARRSAKNAR